MVARGGLTLLELLIAMSVMVMVVGTLAVLASGIQRGFEYTEGQGIATQHARVALDRIARTVSEATANEQFPGAIVLAEQENTWRFPDTLVVWHPTGSAADPSGLPRFSELVIYCPSSSAPNQLVELTAADDARVVPPVADTARWSTEIAAIKKSTSTQTIVLSALVRTCSVLDSSNPKLRGAVRFETRLRPSQSEWDSYKAGSLAWGDLSWVQGICGAKTGLRQVWVRTELQLMPGTAWAASDPAGQRAVAFFGSGARYYDMHR